MKRIQLLVLFGLIGFTVSAQQPSGNEIESMLKNGKYKEVIEKYASADLDYSSETLHFIALAYLETENEANGLRYLDLSISKDANNPEPYYTKGLYFMHSNKPEDAVPCFTKAVELNKDPEKILQSYYALGLAYYYVDNKAKALETYEITKALDESDPFPHIMMANIYNEIGQNDKALESFKAGLAIMSPEEEDYKDVLYNIALLQQLNGNYTEAENAYNQIITIAPEDYHAYAKLIQIHYYNKEYDKAIPLKKVLYDAQKENKLPEHMQDMFCIDQFKWKDKNIQVYERYEQGDKSTIYNKLHFYIIDDEGKIIFRIQTEYSPIAVAMESVKYILCATKDDRRINYGIGFNDDSSYDSIKNAVISVLEKDQDLN